MQPLPFLHLIANPMVYPKRVQFYEEGAMVMDHRPYQRHVYLQHGEEAKREEAWGSIRKGKDADVRPINKG